MRPLLALLAICLACRPYIPERSRIEAITAAAGAVGEELRTASVADLAWLSGCWSGRMGSAAVEEFWSAPRSGSLVGMSRTMRGDSTVGYELLLISVRGGELVLDATPHGQGTTSFTSSWRGSRAITFANPAHDFPQQIRYRLVARDSLLAQLEGPGGNGRRTIDIPMARMGCAPSRS